jgi:hypothetical protein
LSLVVSKYTEYASLLEHHGLEVREASLFDRSTPVEGENGMEDWIEMFCGAYFRDLPVDRAQTKIRELTAHLRPILYRDGVWTLDYRRLRVVAVTRNEKPETRNESI